MYDPVPRSHMFMIDARRLSGSGCCSSRPQDDNIDPIRRGAINLWNQNLAEQPEYQRVMPATLRRLYGNYHQIQQLEQLHADALNVWIRYYERYILTGNNNIRELSNVLNQILYTLDNNLITIIEQIPNIHYPPRNIRPLPPDDDPPSLGARSSNERRNPGSASGSGCCSSTQRASAPAIPIIRQQQQPQQRQVLHTNIANTFWDLHINRYYPNLRMLRLSTYHRNPYFTRIREARRDAVQEWQQIYSERAGQWTQAEMEVVIDRIAQELERTILSYISDTTFNV